MQTDLGFDTAAFKRQRAAKLISDITSPPFLALPIYVILAFYDQSQHNLSWLQVLLALVITVAGGVLLPIGFVMLLRSRKLVTSMHIPLRQQRTLPYTVTILIYLLTSGLDYWVIGGGTLTAIMCAYTINGLLALFINFKWKISAHAIGVGGPLAILTVLYGWTIALLYVVFLVVGWARLELKAHTLAQVIGGSIFGLGSTLIQLLCIFRPLGWL
jgi:membrane-associated phospholipid phosphatase